LEVIPSTLFFSRRFLPPITAGNEPTVYPVFWSFVLDTLSVDNHDIAHGSFELSGYQDNLALHILHSETFHNLPVEKIWLILSVR